jgi:hypothetical protein
MSNVSSLRAAIRVLASMGIHTTGDLHEQVLAKGRRLREVPHGHS